MEFLDTIYAEMTRGNFSLAILVVGELQLLFQIITFIILIMDRRLQKLMFGTKKKPEPKVEFEPLDPYDKPVVVADLFTPRIKQTWEYKLREAKKLITEAELEFGETLGNMEFVNMMVDMENSITYILSNGKSADV